MPLTVEEFDQLTKVISEELKSSSEKPAFILESSTGKSFENYSGLEGFIMKFLDGDDERAVLTGEKDLLDAWKFGTVDITAASFFKYSEITNFRKLLATVSGKGKLAPLTFEEVKKLLEARYALISAEEQIKFFSADNPFAWSIVTDVDGVKKEVFRTPEMIINKAKADEKGTIAVYARKQSDAAQNVITVRFSSPEFLMSKIFIKTRPDHHISFDGNPIEMKPEGLVMYPEHLANELLSAIGLQH